MKYAYTAGQLAEMAGVSSRTVRYYDEKGLLKPIAHSEGGYRLYDNDSLLQLQKIRMLQFAGLSLEEIGHIVARQKGANVSDILWGRKLLMMQQRDQLNRMISSLDNVISACKDIKDETDNMQKAFEILKLTNMEMPFDDRFHLYEAYSENQKEWHPWVFEQMELFPGARVLDMGSGHGMVWLRNWTMIPENTTITVVDKLSSGVNFLERFYQENKRFLQKNVRFVFLRQDLEKDFIFYEKYDRIVANHLWKFITDVELLMEKAKNALCKDGILISTLSSFGVMERMNVLFQKLALPMDFSDVIRQETDERNQIEKRLAVFFPIIEEETFESKLVGIDDAKILIQYVENKFSNEYAANSSVWKECSQKLNQYFAECGAIKISNFTSLYKCRKV